MKDKSNGFADFFGIGISRYPDYFDADYAADDCGRVAAVLRRTGLLRMELQVTDAGSDSLPVRNRIFRAARRFVQIADRRRPKIFYFAGHGITLGQVLHICPSDFDPIIADKSAIDVSEFIAEFSTTSPWSIFVFDCCRAALLSPTCHGATSPASQLSGSMRIMDNSVLIFACSNDEYALEAASIAGSQGGGIFTHYLVKELERTFSKPNRLAVADVFERVREATSDFVAQNADKRQVPRMFGAHGGDYFLVRRRPGSRKSVDAIGS